MNEETVLTLGSVNYYYFFNTVAVPGISLRRGSKAWPPLSAKLSELEVWTSLFRNGRGFLVNSDCFKFYCNN